MSTAPIWAVAAPGARKPRFTRAQIAATALAIADTEGFEALSMRRVADALGAGTMTLYYYVRTKEDLLALVEDAFLGEICDACEPIPTPWRRAIKRLAAATRATCLRHPWALRAMTGQRLGPNRLRHIEQSLQSLARARVSTRGKLAMLSIIDDYVFGHCAGLLRERGPALDRKDAKAVRDTLTRFLVDGAYPQLHALIDDRDPLAVLVTRPDAAEGDHFDAGLDALLDGLARRYER